MTIASPLSTARAPIADAATRAAILDRHTRLRPLLAPITPEDFAVGWLPATAECKTAYWRFDKSGVHMIRINPTAAETLTAKHSTAETADAKSVRELLTAVYDHERAHSVFTTRDLAGLAKTLRSERIPWRLCNLFEDCRIEHLWEGRGLSGFGWSRWQPIDELPLGTPAAVLYALKVCKVRLGSDVSFDTYGRECVSVIRSSSFSGRRESEFWPVFGDAEEALVRKVAPFYVRICSAATTEDLIPILKDWIEAFPPDEEGNSPESDEELGGGGGDLAEAIDQSDDAPEGEDGEGSDTESDQPAPEGDEEGEKTGSIRDQDEEFRRHKGPHVRTSEAGSLEPRDSDPAVVRAEKQLAQKLAAYLAKAFKQPGRTACNGPTPSKRLNVRGIIKQDYRNGYRTIRNTDRADVPHVAMLIDCSGSMSGGECGIYPDDVAKISRGCSKLLHPRSCYGTPDLDKATSLAADQAGRIFAMALHILAKRRILSATVYLTRDGGVTNRLALPLTNEKQFYCIQGDSGSEGIGAGLHPTSTAVHRITKVPRSAFKEIVSKTRTALVWTEGAITDEPTDRTALRRAGLFTVGLLANVYTGYQDSLDKHFDVGICRTSLFGLAGDLVKLMRSGATAKGGAK